jgi:hypothetical protein
VTVAADIPARVRDCAYKAATILEDGQAVTPDTVLARRTAADIALSALFGALKAAFITSVDREDLWRLCDAGERVLRAAEELHLSLRCCSRTVSVPICAVCKSLADACRACAESVGGTVDAKTLSRVRRAEHLCQTMRYERYADGAVRTVCDSGAAVIDACDHLLYTLRYTVLKNT